MVIFARGYSGFIFDEVLWSQGCSQEFYSVGSVNKLSSLSLEPFLASPPKHDQCQSYNESFWCIVEGVPSNRVKLAIGRPNRYTISTRGLPSNRLALLKSKGPGLTFSSAITSCAIIGTA